MADSGVKPYNYYTRRATKRRLSRKQNTFGSNQKVSTAVAERTAARLNSLGKEPKGVDVTDGITGREARIVRRARAKKKARRMMARYVRSRGGDASGYNA